MDFNKIKEMGLEYAEKGKNAAMDLAERGKTQAKIVNEQTKLARAQRQLGALVYSLAKGNEENQPLVDKYIEMIDAIEKNLAALRESIGTPAAEAAPEPEAPADSVTIEFPMTHSLLRRKRRPARSAVLPSRTMHCSATSAARSCDLKLKQPEAGGVRAGYRPFLCQSVKNLETFGAKNRKMRLSP